MPNAEANTIDRRALILRWIEEQEALCAAATTGPWWGKGLSVRPPADLALSYADGSKPSIATVWDMPFTKDEWPLGKIKEGSAKGNVEFVRESRTVLPLALAALRAEIIHHEVDDSCGWDDDVGANRPCPTIDRLFCSLGLQDSGR